MKSKKMIISNPSGLHVRPAGILAHAAEQCSSKVELIVGNSIINCRSILNICPSPSGREMKWNFAAPEIRKQEDLKFMEQVIADELER